MKHNQLLLCLFSLILIVFLLSGCSLGQFGLKESLKVTVDEIGLTNDDNIDLAGTLFRAKNSDIAVVMAHSGAIGEDQNGLHPFARELTEKRFTTLTFDFQGIGQSGGATAFAMVDKDIHAAITFLRDQGFTDIVCMGVGLGGLACAKSGREPNLVGLVLISSPTDITSGKLEMEPEMHVTLSTLE